MHKVLYVFTVRQDLDEDTFWGTPRGATVLAYNWLDCARQTDQQGLDLALFDVFIVDPASPTAVFCQVDYE